MFVHQWPRMRAEERDNHRTQDLLSLCKDTEKWQKYLEKGQVDYEREKSLLGLSTLRKDSCTPLNFPWSLKEALADNPVSRSPPRGKYTSHSLLEWESFRKNHPVDLFEIITWGIVLTLRANEGLKKSSRDEVEHELGKWRHLYKWLRVTATSCEIWGNSLNFSNYKNKLHILIHVMAMLG